MLWKFVGFSLGNPPTYFDVSTTAIFTPPVNVCISYDPAEFGDPSMHRLLHLEDVEWVDITMSNDTTSHVNCGLVNSLSPFVIAERLRPNVGSLSSVPAAVGGSVVIAIGGSVTFSALWTGPGLSDAHTATCNIVDVSGATPPHACSGRRPRVRERDSDL